MVGGFVAAGILFSLFMLSLIFLFVIGNKVRKSVFGKRYDSTNLKYHSEKDFPALHKEEVSFSSSKKGCLLKGFIYSNGNENVKGLMIVSHGLGCGHRQLMDEINQFVENGYKVFAFDYLGCGESQGENVEGFPQAAKDFIKACEYIDSQDSLKNLDKYVFAHSMGAYSAIVSLNERDDIKGIVAMSCFDTSYDQLGQELANKTNGNMKIYNWVFKKIDRHKFGKNAFRSVGQTIVDNKTPILFIAGELDTIVNPVYNFEMFKSCTENDETKEYLLVKDRYTKPDLSLAAATYDNETNQQYYQMYMEEQGNISENKKKEFYDSLDNDLLQKLDEKVMKQIIEFFEKIK